MDGSTALKSRDRFGVKCSLFSGWPLLHRILLVWDLAVSNWAEGKSDEERMAWLDCFLRISRHIGLPGTLARLERHPPKAHSPRAVILRDAQNPRSCTCRTTSVLSRERRFRGCQPRKTPKPLILLGISNAYQFAAIRYNGIRDEAKAPAKPGAFACPASKCPVFLFLRVSQLFSYIYGGTILLCN
jgi:hypothetical protein